MGQAVEPSETHHHRNAPLSPWPEGQRAARYEALLCASHVISAQRDPKAVFRVLVSELRHVVTFDALSVVLYDEATRQRSWHGLEIVNQPDAVPPSDFAPEDMVTWWAYHHQQPVVISCVVTETRFPRMMARLVVYLPNADKYRRLTRRPSQEQKGIDERALMASQRPSPPW
jgi:hypothetical protein